MSCCSHCQDAGDLFSDRTAKRDLRRYRKKGPNRSTVLLLDAVQSAVNELEKSTLLDVGSGIGAIQLELFKENLQHATNIDASQSYLNTCREEAKRRGVLDRTDYHFGDAVEVASRLPDADIVTLDRVICCYPNPEKLIGATASKAKKVYGVVYPRERMISKMVIKVGNFWFRLRRKEFRTYLFAANYIDTLIRKQGLVPYKQSQTFMWQMAVYVRKA